MSTASQSRAEQACSACKKLKRKCDKSLPQCGLCSRTGRSCDYSGVHTPAPTASDIVAVQSRVAELEDRLTASLNIPQSPDNSASGSVGLSDTYIAWRDTRSAEKFPSAVFLDIDCYKWAGMRLPRPPIDIPTEVLALLTQGNVVVETATEYFDTVHTWMPILSKKRFNLGIAVLNGGPDIAMLFLAMRLIVSQPGAENVDLLYRLSKDFLGRLEAAGFLSQLCLQAMLLVALYEYSHGIYPAAWMTVGACARYVDLLGLSCNTGQVNVMRPSVTWTELEERKRLWWAIFILDRLTCMGSKRRFCLPGPLVDGILPVQDEAWDEGDVTRVQARPVSINAEAYNSPFTWLCQAAILVGSAIENTWNFSGDNSHLARASGLIDKLCKSISIIDSEVLGEESNQLLRLLAPRCLIRSALFLVIDPYVCPEKMTGQPGLVLAPGAKSADELQLQNRCIGLLQEFSEETSALAAQLMMLIGTNPPIEHQLARMSPCSLDLFYCSLASFYWLSGEGGGGVYRQSAREIEMWLEKVGVRWKLALEYLDIAKFYDVTVRSSFMDTVN